MWRNAKLERLRWFSQSDESPGGGGGGPGHPGLERSGTARAPGGDTEAGAEERERGAGRGREKDPNADGLAAKSLVL